MEKIWLQSYAEGVPETIDPDQYSSLVAALDAYCRQYADQTAFSNFGTKLTYQQLQQYTRQLAAYFQQELSLKPGDRVAIMMPNLLQYPVTLFAVLRAGLVVVNVNPLYTPRELAHELKDSGAKAIIVLANFAHVVAEVMSSVPLEHVLVTELGDLLGKRKGFLYSWVVKHIMRLVPAWKIKNARRFMAGLQAGKHLSFVPPEIQAGDMAFLQYTGGTTGTPKGAMLSHRNLIANLLQCEAWISGKLQVREEVLLTALPLYHIFSLTVSCFTFLALGGHCVLVTNPRDIRSLVKIWRKSSPTVFIGLNTLFLHLMKNPRFSRLDFQKLKLTIAGGMALHPQVAQQWQALTGHLIIEGYGLTEASPVVTINPLNLRYFNHSIGLPVPATEVKICNDQGDEMPLGEKGELMVKGPQVMLGYWQNPQETADVLDAHGWLRTGDIGCIDALGFAYLTDRKKDMIIVSGFNVYPSEVEEVIGSHPGVAEVAVIGVPSNATGEIVKALIVKKDPQLTAAAIINYCHQQLTPYKVPKQVEFRDSLPKSAIGKILHRR